MSTPKLIRSVAVVVGGIWTSVIYVSDIQLPTFGQQFLANTPTLLLALALAFDLWLWKLPLINKLHVRPRIFGTWTTTITPHEDSHIPEGGDRGPIVGETVIEQTFWTLTITMRTGESESVSRAENIAADGGSRSRKVLTYTYTNTPQLAVRHRSNIHVGAAMLTLDGPEPQAMTGIYWTDRLSVGDLILARRQ